MKYILKQLILTITCVSLIVLPNTSFPSVTILEIKHMAVFDVDQGAFSSFFGGVVSFLGGVSDCLDKS